MCGRGTVFLGIVHDTDPVLGATWSCLGVLLVMARFIYFFFLSQRQLFSTCTVNMILVLLV